MSILQRTILILSILLLIALAARAVVPPLTSVTLAWDKAPSHDETITYVLQWGTSTNSASTNFYNNIINAGTGTRMTLVNPTTGYLYFRVVAKSVEGLVSLPSNVVAETNYPAAPLQLRMQTNTTSSVDLEFLDGATWKHLVTVSNDFQTVLSQRQNLILRSKQNVPLLPQ